MTTFRIIVLLLTIGIVVVVCRLVWRVVAEVFGLATHARGRLICANCGTRYQGGDTTPGSIWIEIILWLCFIVPGLIYSLWRLSARKRACSACGSTDLIPVDSPRGRHLQQELQSR